MRNLIALLLASTFLSSSALAGYGGAGYSASAPVFTGDSGSGGAQGLVPAPPSGSAAAKKYLKADGTWATAAQGAPAYYQSTLFDVGRYINLGNNIDVTNTTAFSFCGWAKPSDVGAIYTLIKKIDGTPTGYDLYIGTGGTLNTHILKTVTTNEIRTQTNSQVVFPLVWNHFCFTVDGTSTAAGVKTYANGVMAAVTVGFDNLVSSISNTGSLYFGHATNQASDFSGAFQNFAYYSKALSSSEVSAVYGGSPYNPPNLSTLSSAPNLGHWWLLGVGDSATTSNGFLDSASGGTVTGTGTGMSAQSIVADYPANYAGGMNSVNPGWAGTLFGLNLGVGDFGLNANVGSHYVVPTINGESMGTWDGRYNPPIWQLLVDLWDSTGKTQWIGAGSGVSGGLTAPFKGVLADRMGVGYANNVSIPSIPVGSFAVAEAGGGADCAGTATLNGSGTITVTTSCAKTTSRMFLARTASGVGVLATTTKSAGSFVVTSSNVADSGTLDWIIFNH